MTEINPSYSSYNLYSIGSPNNTVGLPQTSSNNEEVFKDFRIAIVSTDGKSASIPKTISVSDIEHLNFSFVEDLNVAEQEELINQAKDRLSEIQQEQDKSPTGEYKEQLDKLQNSLEALINNLSSSL